MIKEAAPELSVSSSEAEEEKEEHPKLDGEKDPDFSQVTTQAPRVCKRKVSVITFSGRTSRLNNERCRQSCQQRKCTRLHQVLCINTTEKYE